MCIIKATRNPMILKFIVKDELNKIKKDWGKKKK